ncbi:hypothetical protein PPACK8108_LOCUS25592 [Phakopsora pachyrhizi]|uniref:Uncharacterized protein n=1 Tax=Phakopsora pachyrhizi TaxID=170000 RepID=A0AAV0BVL4_PHAPC|nr:hypothetical protein PPACK8108_LOCUS25592 [Phakopsora pachyrhizi]
MAGREADWQVGREAGRLIDQLFENSQTTEIKGQKPLPASPKNFGLGKLIAKKVLEDKDVLQIGFGVRKALMNEFHTDYKDFLKSNRWNKGFGNILDGKLINLHAEVLKILQFLAFLHDN